MTGERVFVIGPNASGKSNFLDALLFLRDIAKPREGGLQKAVAKRQGMTKLRCVAARHDPDIEIEVELSENERLLWRYALGIVQNRGQKQPHLSFERVWQCDTLILDRPKDPRTGDKEDPLRLTQTHLEQINTNKDFRPVAQFLERIRYLHLVPQLLRHPEAFTGPGIPGDPFGRGFLELIAHTPPQERKRRLKTIETALKVAVPQLQKLTDIKDKAGFTHLQAIYQHWRAQGAKQQEEQFSDGTLRLIGLLWSLLDEEAPLLLEEPELSLNAGIVRHLPGLFYRIQSTTRRQLFLSTPNPHVTSESRRSTFHRMGVIARRSVLAEAICHRRCWTDCFASLAMTTFLREDLGSTHSADLLRDKGIGGEEVLLLSPSREGTRVEVVSHIRDVRSMLEGGMSIAEAVLPKTVPPSISQLELSFNATHSG